MTSEMTLQDIFAIDWKWEMNDNPEFSVQAGDHANATGLLQDVSPTAYSMRLEHSKRMLAMLASLKSSSSRNLLCIFVSLSKYIYFV